MKNNPIPHISDRSTYDLCWLFPSLHRSRLHWSIQTQDCSISFYAHLSKIQPDRFGICWLWTAFFLHEFVPGSVGVEIEPPDLGRLWSAVRVTLYLLLQERMASRMKTRWCWEAYAWLNCRASVKGSRPLWAPLVWVSLNMRVNDWWTHRCMLSNTKPCVHDASWDAALRRQRGEETSLNSLSTGGWLRSSVTFCWDPPPWWNVPFMG